VNLHDGCGRRPIRKKNGVPRTGGHVSRLEGRHASEACKETVVGKGMKKKATGGQSVAEEKKTLASGV